MPEQPTATPRAVFHEEPFPELFGLATEAVLSDDGEWIAVSSVLSQLSRVAVYRTADLSCAHVLTVAMETETMAFHPTLPLLAIGFDNGDAYMREGRLVLLDPTSGHRVDFADPHWGVELIRWTDASTLELTFCAMHDGVEFERSGAVVAREEWRGLAPDAVDLSALRKQPLAPDAPLPYPDRGPAPQVLRALAERAGLTYEGRGGVRAVAGLSDGRVLATRKHTALECRAPDGTLLWSVPAPSAVGGTRIEVSADERTARVVVAGPDSRTRTDFPLVDTSDGTVLDNPSVPFSAALSARTDGAWAIRDTYDRSSEKEGPDPNTRVFAADGTPLVTVHEPDRYDLVPVDARRCPELLFGRRRLDVIALDPRSGAETTLFPLEPFRVDRPLGRAVYVSDAGGPALLHGWTELVRRAFPAGDVVWTLPLGSEAEGSPKSLTVVDLDAHGGVLHALCTDGTLLSVDAADGTVLDRRPLPPYGPLSVHAAPDGTVLVGTAAGRILRY